MSDWQVGDLAVCVDVSPCRCGCGSALIPGLEIGRSYQVLGLSREEGWLALQFAPQRIDWPHIEGWSDAERFRKILPDKHEECEPEFVTLLKRIKHTVSA